MGEVKSAEAEFVFRNLSSKGGSMRVSGTCNDKLFSYWLASGETLTLAVEHLGFFALEYVDGELSTT